MGGRVSGKSGRRPRAAGTVARAGVAAPPANDGDRRRAAPSGLPSGVPVQHLARVFADGVAGLVSGSVARGPDWANAAFLRMSGYSRADVAARRLDWSILAPPEARETNVAQLATARHAGFSPAYETELLRRDGSRRPVLASYAVDAADADRATLLVIDLVGPRGIAATRRDDDARYAGFFKIANVAFWTADAGGRVTFSTKTTADRLGTDEVLDGTEAQATLIHPDDRAYAIATWERALGDGTAYDIEVRARSYHEGAYLWTRLQCFPELVDGKVIGWYGTSEIVHERRLAANALAESEARFKRLANDIPVIVWVTDHVGDATYLSKGWYEFTGQSEAEAMARGWTTRIHPDDSGRRAQLSGFVAARRPFDVDFRVRGADDDYRWMLSSGRPRFDGGGEWIGYVGCLIDIHARKTAEHELAALQLRLSRALDGTGVGVWEWDAAADTVTVSGSALSLSGFPAVEADYQQVDYRRAIHPDDRPRLLAAMAAYVAGTASDFVIELRVRTRAGGWIWVLDRGTATERDAAGRALHMVGTLTNIDDSKRAEARLRWTVEHDALTGLANRSLFHARLDAALARGGRVALALLDVDEFKGVNDVLGHDAGDALLVALAARLTDFASSGETVARLGGDEFTLIVPDCGDADAVLARFEALRLRLAEPFVHLGQMLSCRASIGVTVAPDHGRDASSLLRNADIAMYAAKVGRNAVTLFDMPLAATLHRQADRYDVVRGALRDARVGTMYQPMVRLADGAVVGLKVLVGIAGDRGGADDPRIVAGGSTELALELGEVMLDHAFADRAAWALGGDGAGMMSFSASGTELRRGDYAERLLHRAAAAGVAPSLLCVGVASSEFGRGSGVIEAALAKLRAAGVGIVLDGFGTGQGGLTLIKRLPLSGLKIPPVFIAGLGTDDSDTAIVRAVIDLAKAFKLAAVAGGITTRRQADMLSSLDCAFGLGDHFSPPLDAAAAGAVIRRAAAG